MTTRRPRAADERSAASVLDSLPDGVVVVEGDGTVGWMNRAAESMTGWARDEAIGRGCAEVLAILDGEGQDLCSRAPLGRRLPLVKGLPEREYELRTRSGDYWPVAVRCAYEKDESEIVRRIVCSLRDARARKGMDMRTVELISTVSHEIRSPLTSVKGFTKTLLDRWDRFDDDMKKEMLGAVNADADRVTRLLGELLDISRLEAGKLRLRLERVDLREIAERVIGKLRDRTDRHTFATRFPKSLPPLLADPDKIEQVLTNLVENAIKYTQEGTVTIAGKRAGTDVCVSVGDEGEGIPPAQLPRLFRKFARRELVGSPSGTGLGLFICKGLIEAHGGTLSATSSSTGSTFTFCLPLRKEVA